MCKKLGGAVQIVCTYMSDMNMSAIYRDILQLLKAKPASHLRGELLHESLKCVTLPLSLRCLSFSDFYT